MFENPRRGRQARNLTTNVPKILDLKSSSEQIFSENCRWVPLPKGWLDFMGAKTNRLLHKKAFTQESSAYFRARVARSQPYTRSNSGEGTQVPFLSINCERCLKTNCSEA